MIAVLFTLLVLVLLAMAALRVVRAVARRRALPPAERAASSPSARRRARRAERARRRRERDAYLDGVPFVSFYQLVIIFTVASVGGLVLETVWVYFAMGVFQRRYGMVWGPFSPLYGLGAVVLTLALWRIRKQPVWVVFAVSFVLGSCLEQFAGSVLEDGFHATSWSYESYPDAVTKYVSLRMSAIWGLLGVAWCRVLMPELVWRIREPQQPLRSTVAVVLTAFLVADGVMTVYAAARKDARDQGIPAANAVERWIDERYDDGFMSARFQNVEFGETRDATAEGTEAA